MARETDKRWKGNVINWLEIADMDALDYDLKPLNQQQVAILLMLLEYQKWDTRWTNLELSKDELHTFIGEIEYRLMSNEGGGMATKEDIRDGIYEAVNRISLQIASGGFAGLNFSTDSNGTVTPNVDASNDLPENDPATPFDDSLAAKMGGTIAVTRALELLYDKLDTYYGTVNGTPVTLLATTQTLIKAFFACDGAAMDTAIASYYTYRNTNARLLFDVSSSMQLYVFCRGGNERAWGQWLSDQSGYVIAKFTVMNDLSSALSDTFWTGYFSDGSAIPSTQYYDAGCVPIAPQTLTGLVFATLRRTTPLKSLHRMKIKTKGYALDTSGNIQDAYWYRTAAGVVTRSNWSWVHSAGSNLPSDNQVVYSASHEYEYTIDLGALNQYMDITPNKNAGMIAAGLTYPVPFEVTMIDLGEYSV
ncbi:MAG: hypothetical protein [Caudoviricetes sp.]|nr:MAG: hypothetical protein [Caudoviricetes sp.]